jgi:hypothetical protein
MERKEERKEGKKERKEENILPARHFIIQIFSKSQLLQTCSVIFGSVVMYHEKSIELFH